MPAYLALVIVYSLITIGSASILYYSFKNAVDSSGKYFLLAEFLVLALTLQLLLSSLFTNLINPVIFFAANLTNLSSETAVLFSLYTLDRKVDKKRFVVFILLIAFYCAFIEYCRFSINPKLPLLLFPIASLTLAVIAMVICKTTKNSRLKINLFFKGIYFLQFGIAIIAVMRIVGYELEIYINPRGPDTFSTLFFALLLTLNIFRYISYQSLRISWVDPRGTDDNPLNQNLVKLVKEKNQFLQGLISSNRALGISALANSLAHQLSQPIQGILLQAESVKRDLIDLGTKKESVNMMTTITEQLGRLSELVNNLRRLFTFRQAEFKPFHLQTSCDEILEIIDPTLKSKNIALHKVYESDPIALGDPIQIQQVLINLFNNAIDAIGLCQTKERFIRLRITQDQDFAVIEIQDSGSGIDEAIAPQIFELYQSNKPDGLGIGLWLSKTIIDHHGGIITVVNSDNGGAIFRIQIPLAN